MTYRTNNFKAEIPSFSIEDTIEEFEKQGLLGKHPIIEDVRQTCKDYREVLTEKDSEMMVRKVLDSLADEANLLLREKSAPYLIVNKRQFDIHNCATEWFPFKTLLVRNGKVYSKTLYKCIWIARGGFWIRMYTDPDTLADHTRSVEGVAKLFQDFIVGSLKLIRVTEAITALRKKGFSTFWLQGARFDARVWS